MNAMSPARRWAIRIGGLSLAILIMTMTAAAARAQTSTTSSSFMVSANVINSCSFDSTNSQTLAITCSTQTPVATSSTGAPSMSNDATGAQSSTNSMTNTAAGTGSSSGFGSGAGTNSDSGAGPSTSSTVRLPTTKLCNFLAIARLENASFNQYSLNITQMTTGPQRYYSTMQVCF